MEMYADVESRGGILEPPGICEVKFKAGDQVFKMHEVTVPLIFVTLHAIFFFLDTFTFQLLDKPWSQVSSLVPPGSCLQFLSRIGFSTPTDRRIFIECC